MNEALEIFEFLFGIFLIWYRDRMRIDTQNLIFFSKEIMFSTTCFWKGQASFGSRKKGFWRRQWGCNVSQLWYGGDFRSRPPILQPTSKQVLTVLSNLLCDACYWNWNAQDAHLRLLYADILLSQKLGCYLGLRHWKRNNYRIWPLNRQQWNADDTTSRCHYWL